MPEPERRSAPRRASDRDALRRGEVLLQVIDRQKRQWRAARVLFLVLAFGIAAAFYLVVKNADADRLRNERGLQAQYMVDVQQAQAQLDSCAVGNRFRSGIRSLTKTVLGPESAALQASRGQAKKELEVAYSQALVDFAPRDCLALEGRLERTLADPPPGSVRRTLHPPLP